MKTRIYNSFILDTERKLVLTLSIPTKPMAKIAVKMSIMRVVVFMPNQNDFMG